MPVPTLNRWLRRSEPRLARDPEVAPSAPTVPTTPAAMRDVVLGTLGDIAQAEGAAGRLSRVFLRRTDAVRLAARVAAAPETPTALGVSAGVAELRDGESAAAWCARADAALYAAKRAGKGRVES
jgi:GGDEF domain-containing protein